MSDRYSPVIIVVAFNRPLSLSRLLCSLKSAKNIAQAKLIISIDNNEPYNFSVREIAEAFEWPFGEKEVIYREKRLGLRNHIIQCGDLSETYGSVIVLEDDLFVSPFFYDYTVKALEFYKEHEEIGGISLYTQPREEISDKPFYPLNDGSDVYFMQFPSSWGQAWTAKQWASFKKWYNGKPDISSIDIPKYVLNWPETSWKKYFCAFLVDTNKYFVFPRVSMTTNFNEPGTNYKMNVNYDGQATLNIIEPNNSFRKLNESLSIYDAFFEIDPEIIKYHNKDLKTFDFELDLYGRKELSKIKASNVITSRPCKNPIKGFKRALKPQEMNIILNLEGNHFHLCNKKNITYRTNIIESSIADYQYYYYRRLPSIKLKLYFFLKKIR